MKCLLSISLLLLLSFYLVTLFNFSPVIAFVLFFLTIVSMVGAICQELDKNRRVRHLTVIK
ncbi:hypothetical protein [Niallia endozanthoxylica]|uniref:Uncharacterized protein n=1 Tax=Niallia endozanthoxylica TaxID=2036016 RepID=A0A5J5HNT6_9BACI|nr:hypothetical protein [Niallia endozanthoxylica]KAA9022658.1 hypothetical protein F4V44_15425 [Niallia endozanthoxylica]